jgi:hypothetical protein
MDPSVLEQISRNLESSLDCWGRWLLIATGVVVLGLILEYWEPIRDVIKKYRTPEFAWKDLLKLTGGILITVGVAGELFFTYEASRVENSLRKNNHQIEQRLTEDAEATFMRTRPRIIFDNKTFQDALQGKPKANVEILFKPEDEEAWSLAGQIKARLTDTRPGLGADWTVSVFRPLKQSDALIDDQLNRPEVPLAIKSGAWYGLGLVVKSATVCPPPWKAENESAACALQLALSKSGVGGGKMTSDPRMPDSVIKIIIGQEESGH